MLPPYYVRVFAGICVIVTYLFCQQLAKVINNQNGVDIQNYENLRSSGFGRKFDSDFQNVSTHKQYTNDTPYTPMQPTCITKDLNLSRSMYISDHSKDDCYI